MKKIIALTLTLLCVLQLCACSSGTKTEQPQGQEEKTVTVSTPYVDLKVPESLDQNASHEENDADPYVITFKSKADDTILFSFVFNGTGERLLGTLIGEKENTVISLNVPELDEASEHYEENLANQQQMDVIIDHLLADYQIVLNEVVEQENTAVFDIETSVVTLKYPAKWKETVQVDVQENGVKFSSDGTPLFDLMFVECDGYLLGTYKDTPIYMVEYPVESDEHAAMQNGVNVILQNLMQDPNFAISN